MQSINKKNAKKREPFLTKDENEHVHRKTHYQPTDSLDFHAISSCSEYVRFILRFFFR